MSASGLTVDIAQRPRDLGGTPDLGAYEADLPAAGSVIYVRVNGTGDGSSWANAMNDIYGAVQKAVAANSDASQRPDVWVAAGTYAKDPNPGDPACFIIEEGVNVYGGFPADGNPGMDDRRPLDENYETV